MDSLLADFKPWYNYTYWQVRLSRNFVAKDTNGASLVPVDFLRRLSAGGLVVLNEREDASRPVYRLYQSSLPLPSDIKNEMIRMAEEELAFRKQEGALLPSQTWNTLDGRKLSSRDSGHLRLVKCWFINCVACVKEFGELNALVDQYNSRKDLEFISLAIDEPAPLNAFLQKRPFKYAVVPRMGSYMSEEMNISAYPTHLLLNREGRIVKVTDNIEDMIPWLERELQQKEQ